MNRKVILIVVAVFVAVVASACGGSGTKAPPAVMIAITTAPPTSMTADATVSIAASVTNDSSNAGVNWVARRPVPAELSIRLTPDSGAMTAYTAPPSPGSVMVTAASMADAGVTATVNVTINPGSRHRQSHGRLHVLLHRI